jgi:hypothetical protein
MASEICDLAVENKGTTASGDWCFVIGDWSYWLLVVRCWLLAGNEENPHVETRPAAAGRSRGICIGFTPSSFADKI